MTPGPELSRAPSADLMLHPGKSSKLGSMSEVTRILSRIEQGEANATEQLLPLIYDELRRLAVLKMGSENPGQTLQATALVHEAYVRLVDVSQAQHWDSRSHFFPAAAEAMRRILVSGPGQRPAKNEGASVTALKVLSGLPTTNSIPRPLLAVSEALDHLAAEDEGLASLVKLRYFSGFSLGEAASALGISRSTAYQWWAYAKSRLRVMLDEGCGSRS